MNRCPFWKEFDTSTCISVTSNTFWPIPWSKWSQRTKYSTNNFNLNELNWFIIEIWISYPPRYHELTMVNIDIIICLWKINYFFFIIPNNNISFINCQTFDFRRITTPFLCEDSSMFVSSTAAVDNFLNFHWIWPYHFKIFMPIILLQDICLCKNNDC